MYETNVDAENKVCIVLQTFEKFKKRVEKKRIFNLTKISFKDKKLFMITIFDKRFFR